MRFVIGLLALGLAGCANASGTELGGVASFYGPDSSTAVKAASAHCAKYNRTAKPTNVDWSGYLTFSCEKS